MAYVSPTRSGTTWKPSKPLKQCRPEPLRVNQPHQHWQLKITTYADLKGWYVIVFTTQDFTYMYRDVLRVGAFIRVTGTIYYTPQGVLTEPHPYLIADALQVV